MPLLRALVEGALDLVFAPVCPACRGPVSPSAPEPGICVACWSRARSLPLPRCGRCWSPTSRGAPASHSCPHCITIRPAVRTIRSAYLLEGTVREMVHALKYGGWPFLAEQMARRMARLDLPQEWTNEIRTVVPVPLAPGRRRQRGYNQAERIASAFAAALGWNSAPELLSRTRASTSQTTLHPMERRANVASTFRTGGGDPAMVVGQHLLLLDDVWTTGATATACADALLEAGARAVSVITFARSLPDLERLSRRVESVALSHASDEPHGNHGHPRSDQRVR